MKCYCYLRNIVDALKDGKTPYERRFGEPFNGPIIPFGAKLSYKPITSSDKKRLHQFGIKVLPGIFVGYSLRVGGGWTGALRILDWEDLEKAETISDVKIKQFKAAEINILKNEGNLISHAPTAPYCNLKQKRRRPFEGQRRKSPKELNRTSSEMRQTHSTRIQIKQKARIKKKRKKPQKRRASGVYQEMRSLEFIAPHGKNFMSHLR